MMIAYTSIYYNCLGISIRKLGLASQIYFGVNIQKMERLSVCWPPAVSGLIPPLPLYLTDSENKLKRNID